MSKCTQCGGAIKHQYNPMEGWKTEGPLCGRCYSDMIAKYYPGEHVRVNTGSD